MSRQYSNRPFIPPRRRIPHQLCDFVSPAASQISDTPLDNSPWQSTDSLSRIHQSSASSEPAPFSAQNNLSYYQYPSHQHTIESPLLIPSQETNNNNTNNNRLVHHLHESHPSYNFHLSQSNERESSRPSLPLSLVTVIDKYFFYFYWIIFIIYLYQASATANASAPHHRHYRLENPSAASFARHPPWFDDDSDDNSGTMQRSNRNNNHTKRQRSSAVSTPTSQSSQSYHHNERKRSRHEGINDDSSRSNYRSQESSSQPQQHRSSNHHHYQPYSYVLLIL